MGVVCLKMIVLIGASATFLLLIHGNVPDSPPVPVPLTFDLKMRERMWYPGVKGVYYGVAAHHTATVFPDRRVVSHPSLRRVVPLGRVQLPGAKLAQVVWLAVRARPCEHRPPLWAAMTAPLHPVHYESSPSYVFNLRSLDVSPAVQRWVVCLSG